jgi:hypothetical protein
MTPNPASTDGRHGYSLASSRLSGDFFLPIPIDRAASLYQLLDLSLAVFLLLEPFPIADPLSFEVGALAPSFLGNCLLQFYGLILSSRRRSQAIVVGSAVCCGASHGTEQPASYAQMRNFDLTPISGLNRFVTVASFEQKQPRRPQV